MDGTPTLQLEGNALAGSDLCTGLSHPCQCQWNFFFVAARNPICYNVHIVPLGYEIQSRLWHANMRLNLQSLVKDSSQV